MLRKDSNSDHEMSSASSSEEEAEVLVDRIATELNVDKETQRELRKKLKKSKKMTEAEEKLLRALQEFKNESIEIENGHNEDRIEKSPTKRKKKDKDTNVKKVLAEVNSQTSKEALLKR